MKMRKERDHTRKQSRISIAELKALLTQDKEFLNPFVAEVAQQMLDDCRESSFPIDADPSKSMDRPSPCASKLH